ncbi:collagen alpha-1(XII) chain-like isoform X1 [Octopus sinensis]|uniref:Collagen alpha-1(XII) chain-like isoform X1 n=1 Tax=Octopus sinensis TaxID=2607531 RepID=A0A6P7S9Y5_9MOLL|nr:collagen alpha-1(XII) chain-like isoform X1 [Octopus sinensis]
MYYYQTVLYFSVICLLSLQTVVQSLPAKQCVGKAANIMFVLDSSSSIWIVDYKKQLKYVQRLVDNFNVGVGKSQVSVGAITFSDRAHLEFSLDQYTDSQQVRKAIDNIPYRTGQTNTAEALQVLRSELKPKLQSSSSPFIAIVITDGKSRDTKATKKEAKLLHKLGVHVYAIGVGSNYDLEELKAIASDPVNNVYQVTSYSALQEINKDFGVKPCEDITTPSTTTQTTTTTELSTITTRDSTTTRPTTTTLKSTTLFHLPKITKERPKTITGKPMEIPQRDQTSSIVFGYDLISMGSYRANMITQFINAMLPYTGYGNFRVVSFAHCPVTFNVPVTSLIGKSYLETRNSVNIEVPGLANVIREMRKGKEVNDNPIISKKNTAVLFVDPSVTAITQEVLEESEKLKNEGSKVFLVNVGGNIWPQPQLLHSLSSQPYNNYIYNAPSYNQLLYKAHNTPFKFRAMCKGYRNSN